MKTFVQFCSGGSKIPGWSCRDMDCDITKPLPYDDNSVARVRVEHGAEHISTHECFFFFEEVRRILEPKGTFRLCIPVLDRLPIAHAREIILSHGHQCAFSTNLVAMFLFTAGFEYVESVERDEWDHHHLVIGKERDDLETARFLATK